MPKPCPSGKRRFRDKREAVHALHFCQAARSFARADGVTTNRLESRTYKCPQCKGHHLTSKPARTAHTGHTASSNKSYHSIATRKRG